MVIWVILEVPYWVNALSLEHPDTVGALISSPLTDFVSSYLFNQLHQHF